ncbi:MAG TPA: hypothetical protein VN578_05585 [Candidatus Binatia bacterium]|jgi:hypothetical protein|nr:hypothetical protein [Candidatus Binatia bacterium]
MRTYSKLTIAMLAVLAAAHLAWAVSPMGTAFNFQGYLTDNNKKALSGQYDIQFQLFDVSSGGNALATSVQAPVTVNNGLFSTSVDFANFKFDGNAYWLEVGFRVNGDSNPYQIQSPRIQIRPVPYALYAGTAGTALTAGGVQASSVGTAGLQDNSVTAGKIAGGQVVKSLNGLFDDVKLQGDGTVTVTPNGNTITLGTSLGGGGWSLTGNAGTTPGVNFLGTTDNQPLELWADSSRALRLEYSGYFNPITKSGSTSINLIGGYYGNQALNGAVGVTIAGGGYLSGGLSGNNPNQIAGNFGAIGGGAGNFIRYGTYATIAGGYLNMAGYAPNQTGFYASVGGGVENSAQGTYSAVPGGYRNVAAGKSSLAAGYAANAAHDGSFVWSSYPSQASSFSPNRFHVFGQNGFSVDYDMQRQDGGGSHWAGIGLASGQTISTWISRTYLGDAGDWHGNALNIYDDGTGVGVFGGDLQPFGAATFESNLSSSRTHAWFAENGNCVFNVTGGGAGFFGGNLSVCTLTIRGGCDLAEPFDMAEDEIPKGAVVVIDPQHPGKLKLSTEAYDTRVAGVVSGADGIQPGISMHQEGVNDGGRNVALSGRVYVLADASNGAIRPGDLVTTSATPGHAMKVTDHGQAQGAILGKAMTGLEEGRGTVLVLVTLQ